MRQAAIALVVLAAATAPAERHILAPMGAKLRSGAVRMEAWTQASAKPRFWLDAGLGLKFDASLSQTPGRGVSLDASYNWLAPITDITPGLSVGFQDAFNLTPEGRAVYLAATYRIGNTGRFNQDVPTEVHLGFWTRESGLMFFGVSLPFAREFRLLAEHDSTAITAGFELRPRPEATLRVLWRDGAPGVSLRLSHRF